MAERELDKGVPLFKTGCISCSSSDGLQLYQHGDSVRAHCYVCKKNFSNIDPDTMEPIQEAYMTTTGGTKTIQWVLDNSTTRAIPDRGIPKDIAEEFGVRVSVDPTTGEIDRHFYPVRKEGDITGYKVREVATKQFWTIGDCKAGELFGQHRVGAGGKLLIVTEGELDAMAATEMIRQRGKNYRVVSLPKGANDSGVKANLPWLETFENVFLSLDQDEAGKKAEEDISHVLSQGSIKLMKFSENDPCDMLNAGKAQEYFSAIFSAQEFRPDGIVSVEDVYAEAIKPVEHGLSWPWPTLTAATYGYRRKEIYGFGAGSGCGKCLSPRTLVRTAMGSLIAAEDIRIGDRLLNSKGKSSEVVELGNGVDTMYRVSQTDGTSYIVNSEHILTGMFKGELRDISIKDLLSYTTPMYGVRAVADYPTSQYPRSMEGIDPYILGIWLGDGHSSCASITCGDDEVLSAWVEYGNILNLEPTEYKGEQNCTRINLSRKVGQPKGNRMYEKLKANNLPFNKHIPSPYLRGDISQRLRLLAGILDTDGNLSNNNRYEVISKYPRLAKDIKELANSLGFRVKRSVKRVRGRDYQRLIITGDVHNIPCRVVRKKATRSSRATSKLTITCLGIGLYYGFTLRGDKRFCLADYTITHNTEGFKEIIDHVINTHNLVAGIIFLEEPVAKTLKVLAGKKVNKRFHVPEGDWEQEELEAGIDDLKGKVFLYDHFGGKDWEFIKGQIRYMVHNLGIKDIFLDHLTALVAQENDEYKALNRIMEEMAGLVQELDCTIFYISHLRKASGTPHEEGGHVSADQFKGSGAIVFWSNFLFGYERNQQAEDDTDKNTTLFRVLKDRNTGMSTGTTFKLLYDHSTGRWEEYEDTMEDDEDVL